MTPRLLLMMMTTWLALGCRAFSPAGVNPSEASLTQAQRYFKSGELYRARKITENVLQKQSQNAEAQKLMAEIIDREVGRYKELTAELKAPEEYNVDEKVSQIQIWIERAQTLMDLKQYEEALSAAEKVFLFDAKNGRASRLIDEIKKRALKDGKQEIFMRRQMVHDEIKERIQKYRDQASGAMDAGQWGQAEFAVNKLLLLEPEDPEGLELQEQIKKNQPRAQAA